MRQHSGKVIYLRPKKKSLISKLYKPMLLLFVGIAVVFLYRKFYCGTYVVSEGIINESIFDDAITIKNETPILTPASGEIQFLVESGERVRVGTPLFIITTDKEQKRLYQKEMAEINDKIGALQDKTNNSPSMSLNIINKSIYITTKKLQEAADNGEFDQIKLLQNELAGLIKEKEKKIKCNESNLRILKKRLEQLKDKVNKIDVIVNAPSSGIVSFNIDGFEELLVADKIEDLNFAQLQGIYESVSNKRSPPKNVKANQAVIKIIDNFSWYMAFELKNKEMKIGENYELKINENIGIKAKLAKISEDYTMGFFLINRDLEKLLDLRIVKVEIVTGTYTGKSIPKTALFMNDGEKGVYVSERRKKRFKHIEVVAEDENNVIVKGLNLGDKILLK